MADTHEEISRMLKLYVHTQTIASEMAHVVDEEALWGGLMHFVREPEKFNEQIQSSFVKAGAGDRPDAVFERSLDFGTHRVNDVVYVNKAARMMEFHVQATKEYPSSLLRMEIMRTQQELPAVTFSYYATKEPQVPAAVRPLLEQAWEQKDKDILERIILETLDSVKD